MKKLTNNEFIEKAKEIHGETYDYSLVDYVNSRTNVKIVCPTHGEFNQKPNNHLTGAGCQKCYHESKLLDKHSFINKAKQIHGNKYDYSKTEYLNSKSKVTIICPIHGDFEQKASGHLSGKGCVKCFNENKLSNTSEFINKTKIVHGDKYDYSKTNYINDRTKVIITCPVHGDFTQKPSNHLQGQGCPKCCESKGEREIRQYLESNGINYIPQHKFDDCKHILKLPFDFYLPKYNTCIEYHGEQHYKPVKYFGGDDRFLKQQKLDLIKETYCKNNQIKLIVIKYDEKSEKKLSNYFI